LEARVALEAIVTRFPSMRRNGTAERLLRTRYRGFRHYPLALR
jgi:hypothetical protein